ncbi:MAG: FG-GAP repeat domain-containing protein [Planctomycetota bacterium]
MQHRLLFVAAASTAAFTLTAPLARAQWQPQQNISTSATAAIESVPVDYDGDGDVDFATALLNNDQVVINRNNGNGTYTQISLVTGLTNCGNVHAADMDGDGDTDLLAVGSGNVFFGQAVGSAELVFLRNNGNGSWSIPYNNTNVPGLWDVTSGDINGDGNEDIVYGLGFQFDQIGWQAGTGTGSFGGVQAIATGSAQGNEPRDIHLADVDGDGDLDVLACHYLSNQLSWFRNNNGAGTSWTRVVIESGAAGVREVKTGDLNGDGVLDVVRTTVLNGQVAYFPGTGNGSFGAKQVVATLATQPSGGGLFGTDPQGPRGVDVADLDGDGDLDLVVASEANSRVSVLYNDGSGSFGAPVPASTSANGVNYVEAVDVDVDGDLDVISVSPTANRVLWHEQACTVACADAQSIGASCTASAASFYELMTAGSMDLANTTITATRTATGYSVTSGPSSLAPIGGSATQLALGDDNSVNQVLFYSGTAAVITIGANGWVCISPPFGFPAAPNVSALLNNSRLGYYAWTDLEPATAGGAGGNVFYEASGSAVTVTYDGVAGQGTAGANTIQIRFDLVTGDYSIGFGALSANNPTDWLVGFSPAGASVDPGPTDLSAAAFSLSTSDAAPILSSSLPKLGGTWTLSVGDLGSAPAGILLFGSQALNPGFPLAALGAPGCSAYTNANISTLLIPAIGGTATYPLVIPNSPSLVGASLACQGAVPTTVNAFRIATSNGILATVGN